MILPLPVFIPVDVSDLMIAYFLLSIATFIGQVYAFRTHKVKRNRLAEYLFVLMMAFCWIVTIPMIVIYLRQKLNDYKRWNKELERENEDEVNKLNMDKITLGKEIIKLKKQLRNRNKEKVK